MGTVGKVSCFCSCFGRSHVELFFFFFFGNSSTFVSQFEISNVTNAPVFAYEPKSGQALWQESVGPPRWRLQNATTLRRSSSEEAPLCTSADLNLKHPQKSTRILFSKRTQHRESLRWYLLTGSEKWLRLNFLQVWKDIQNFQRQGNLK